MSLVNVCAAAPTVECPNSPPRLPTNFFSVTHSFCIIHLMRVSSFQLKDDSSSNVFRAHLIRAECGGAAAHETKQAKKGVYPSNGSDHVANYINRRPSFPFSGQRSCVFEKEDLLRILAIVFVWLPTNYCCRCFT